MGVVSVVIPTIWSSSTLARNVIGMADLDEIKEIIVIDNHHKKRANIVHDKIHTLVQERNIYVNPAWNLGAKVASGHILCFMNDDITVRPDLFSYVTRLFEADYQREIGLMGLDWDKQVNSMGYKTVLAREDFFFGSLMFIRAEDFKPIPRPLKIWHGDDYLLLRSILRKKRVLALCGYADEPQPHSISITAIRPKIEKILQRDTFIWEKCLSRGLRLRYRPVGTVTEFVLRRLHPH
jgi:glycosyltransferase involved in cell wall biosynthesis